jgi:histone deacetylase complex regulatory component SIN3
MRYIFGTSVYNMFTVDKSMLQLVKTVRTQELMIMKIQHLVTDPRSLSLMGVYEAESGKSHDSPRQDALYRIKCEEFFQDDDLMFKIETVNPLPWLIGHELMYSRYTPIGY